LGCVTECSPRNATTGTGELPFLAFDARGQENDIQGTMETMEHVVCSFRLQELPVHVIASHITPMVDIKELVALDSTGAMTIGGVPQEARDLMPPIKLPHNLSQSVGIWLLEHGYSLKDCVLPSLVIDGAADLAAVMEQYTKQLHDVYLDLPFDWRVSRLKSSA
jgi:hypothetical protein